MVCKMTPSWFKCDGGGGYKHENISIVYNVKDMFNCSKTHKLYLSNGHLGFGENLEHSLIFFGVMLWLFIVLSNKLWFSPLTFIGSFFQKRKADFSKRCGPDAEHYMLFQDYVLAYQFIMCVLAIFMYFVDVLRCKDFFGSASFIDQDPKSHELLARVLFVGFNLPVAYYMMKHFVQKAKLYEYSEEKSNTLLIKGIPKHLSNTVDMHRFFREVFPDTHIADIQPVFDVSKLADVCDEGMKMTSARISCEKHLDERIKVSKHTPYGLSFCCGDKLKIDGLEYYGKKELKLINQINEEIVKALHKPLGLAFVSFDTHKEAQNICSILKKKSMNFPNKFLTNNWHIYFAPPPERIIWENFSTNHVSVWSKTRWLIEIMMWVLPITIVGGIILINMPHKLKRLSEQIEDNGECIFMLTLSFFFLLNYIPCKVVQWVSSLKPRTTNYKNQIFMTKCYGIFISALVILPFLVFEGYSALYHSIDQYSNGRYITDCMDFPDYTKFYINVFITAIIAGIPMELLVYCDWLYYFTKARSKAELQYFKDIETTSFELSLHYIWTILMFAVSFAYSFVSPTPLLIGFVYMLIKRQKDEFKLYYIIKPDNSYQPKIHLLAALLFTLTTLIPLATTPLILWLHFGWEKITVVSVFLLFVTCIFAKWTDCCFFNKKISKPFNLSPYFNLDKEGYESPYFKPMYYEQPAFMEWPERVEYMPENCKENLVTNDPKVSGNEGQLMEADKGKIPPPAALLGMVTVTLVKEV